MKTLYSSLILLASLLSFQSQAQNYIPFPDSNAMWTVSAYTYEWNGQMINPPMFMGVNYYCMNTEDTVINAVTYDKVGICDGDYVGAVRDNGGQVFCIPKDSTSELLVYDFTKAVGDTIFNVHFGIGWWMSDDLIVAQIDSLLIVGVYHKKFFFEDMSGEWIEGIGDTQGLFEVPYTNLSLMESRLECMSSSNITLYPFYGTGACPMDLNVNEIDNIGMIQVAPNPTTGSFNISSSEEKPFSYAIYKLTGQLLFTSEKEMDGFTIDLTENEAGVYLVRVNIEGRMKNLRIVKE